MKKRVLLFLMCLGVTLSGCGVTTETVVSKMSTAMKDVTSSNFEVSTDLNIDVMDESGNVLSNASLSGKTTSQVYNGVDDTIISDDSQVEVKMLDSKFSSTEMNRSYTLIDKDGSFIQYYQALADDVWQSRTGEFNTVHNPLGVNFDELCKVLTLSDKKARVGAQSFYELKGSLDYDNINYFRDFARDLVATGFSLDSAGLTEITDVPVEITYLVNTKTYLPYQLTLSFSTQQDGTALDDSQSAYLSDISVSCVITYSRYNEIAELIIPEGVDISSMEEALKEEESTTAPVIKKEEMTGSNTKINDLDTKETTVRISDDEEIDLLTYADDHYTHRFESEVFHEELHLLPDGRIVSKITNITEEPVLGDGLYRYYNEADELVDIDFVKTSAILPGDTYVYIGQFPLGAHRAELSLIRDTMFDKAANLNFSWSLSDDKSQINGVFDNTENEIDVNVSRVTVVFYKNDVLVQPDGTEVPYKKVVDVLNNAFEVYIDAGTSKDFVIKDIPSSSTYDDLECFVNPTE